MTKTKLMGTLAACLLSAALIAGCGGDDDDDTTPAASTTASTRTVTSSGTPSASGTASSGNTPAPANTPSSGGGTLTVDDARALLDAALLKPGDVPGEGWSAGNDSVNDAAAQTAAQPEQAASVARCGFLLNRLIVLMNADQVTRYIGGETVSFFSNGTVYATEAGATDCANETAARLADPAELVKLFGSIFVDPSAVVVTPVDFPQIGSSGSAAFKLKGQISAAGTIVDLSIVVVAWREGAVTAAVGSAAAFDPSTTELEPLVQLVAERIAEAQ